jgi:uncharacterized protein
MKIIYCDTLPSKMLGLMFTAKRDRALVFRFDKERIVSLHMFFVFYTIDVVFLDSEKRIVETKRGFRPFGIYFPKKKARYVLELPEGYLEDNKIRIGEVFNSFAV